MSDMEAQTAPNIPSWTLGDRLRKARENAGIKQEEIARRLVKSRAAVSGWEKDQHRPDALAIRAWAHETRVPEWWLLDENRPSGPPTVRYPVRSPVTAHAA